MLLNANYIVRQKTESPDTYCFSRLRVQKTHPTQKYMIRLELEPKIKSPEKPHPPCPKPNRRVKPFETTIPLKFKREIKVRGKTNLPGALISNPIS